MAIFICIIITLDCWFGGIENRQHINLAWLVRCDEAGYLDANSFDGQQEGIEWMKAGDLHELLLFLVWYARLDSLQQSVGLERRDTEADCDGSYLKMCHSSFKSSILLTNTDKWNFSCEMSHEALKLLNKRLSDVHQLCQNIHKNPDFQCQSRNTWLKSNQIRGAAEGPHRAAALPGELCTTPSLHFLMT